MPNRNKATKRLFFLFSGVIDLIRRLGDSLLYANGAVGMNLQDFAPVKRRMPGRLSSDRLNIDD